jgi:hypothetical protein
MQKNNIETGYQYFEVQVASLPDAVNLKSQMRRNMDWEGSVLEIVQGIRLDRLRFEPGISQVQYYPVAATPTCSVKGE